MKYSEGITEILRKRLRRRPWLNTEETIAKMSRDQVFDEVLSHYGIIRYTDHIKNIVEEIYEVKLVDKPGSEIGEKTIDIGYEFKFKEFLYNGRGVMKNINTGQDVIIAKNTILKDNESGDEKVIDEFNWRPKESASITCISIDPIILKTDIVKSKLVDNTDSSNHAVNKLLNAMSSLES